MNYTLLIIGIMFVVLGIIAGTYTITEEENLGLTEDTDVPYQSYMIPLIAFGIILVIIAGIIGRDSKKDKST